jgi:hypothetical protein
LEIKGQTGQTSNPRSEFGVCPFISKPGVPTISATSTLGFSRLGAGGYDAAQRAGALSLSSKFGKQSSFSFSYDQGLRENLSNYRYEELRTRVTGSLRHAGWDIGFGNYVSSSGNALSGPAVNGRGVNIRRLSGRLSDIVIAQPNTYSGAAGGHLVRGRVGIRTKSATLAFSASDFARPAGGYSTQPLVQTTCSIPRRSGCSTSNGG